MTDQDLAATAFLVRIKAHDIIQVRRNHPDGMDSTTYAVGGKYFNGFALCKVLLSTDRHYSCSPGQIHYLDYVGLRDKDYTIIAEY